MGRTAALVVLVVLVVAGCSSSGEAELTQSSHNEISCDARGVLVDGEAINLYAGPGAPDACAGIRFADLVNPQMWSPGSEREFLLTVSSSPGVHVTSPGVGGALVKLRGVECTAYGKIRVETIAGGWRAELDTRCPEGHTVAGHFVGLGF